MLAKSKSGRIVLHATPDTQYADIQLAFNVSRETLKNWRKDRAFPSARREGKRFWFTTAEIAAWCNANGYSVEWI